MLGSMSNVTVSNSFLGHEGIPAIILAGRERNWKEVRMKTHSCLFTLDQASRKSDARRFIASIFKHSTNWEKISWYNTISGTL